jgi:hypothetical protein
MSKLDERVRICSSGPGGLNPENIDDFETAHIRRFCEAMEAALLGNASAREDPETDGK